MQGIRAKSVKKISRLGSHSKVFFKNKKNKRRFPSLIWYFISKNRYQTACTEEKSELFPKYQYLLTKCHHNKGGVTNFKGTRGIFNFFGQNLSDVRHFALRKWYKLSPKYQYLLNVTSIPHYRSFKNNIYLADAEISWTTSSCPAEALYWGREQ